ncbi:unnamed protein product [Haemonchus placei]|uniref:Transposase n=1 Tax=Haemonchus placei TaxID=6290 RepID=A0A0N4WEL6_HAEPC|nr:unnamed protein product [Haemonchus placei]
MCSPQTPCSLTDTTKEIVVAADASDHRVNPVISQLFETLVITSVLRKLRLNIYGRLFKLLTDRKPLLAVFGRKKCRCTRPIDIWAYMVMNYHWTTECRSITNFGRLDTLDCHIAKSMATQESSGECSHRKEFFCCIDPGLVETNRLTNIQLPQRIAINAGGIPSRQKSNGLPA